MPLKKGDKNSGQFKKGMSGNPQGGPKMPDDLRLLMRSTSNQMKRDICEIYLMPVGELMQPTDMSIPAGRAAIMSCLSNSFQTGDFKAINVMLDRVLGRIPEAPIEDESKIDVSKDETIARLVEMINDKPKS